MQIIDLSESFDTLARVYNLMPRIDAEEARVLGGAACAIEDSMVFLSDLPEHADSVLVMMSNCLHEVLVCKTLQLLSSFSDENLGVLLN